MRDSLFIDDINAEDNIYNTIRDGQEPYEMKVRSFMEELWRRYCPYGDADFRQQLHIDLDSRFWEMYLTCTLLDNSIPVKPKPKGAGPDILIEHDSGRIWIEAIAPTSGSQDNPDQVPGLKTGVVSPVPEEQIILRCRSAISEKYDNKYYEYLDNGVVLPSDAYVIAINSCKIESARMESDPPRILKAVYPIGHRQITIDKKLGKIIRNGFQIRYSIKRASGTVIPTDLFLNQKYENLSGVLYSRASVRKLPDQLGDDFVFIHNLMAKNRISHAFLRVGTEYVAHEKPNSYEIRRAN